MQDTGNQLNNTSATALDSSSSSGYQIKPNTQENYVNNNDQGNDDDDYNDDNDGNGEGNEDGDATSNLVSNSEECYTRKQYGHRTNNEYNMRSVNGEPSLSSSS